jgi:NAD(P)H-hydrate epimerase
MQPIPLHLPSLIAQLPKRPFHAHKGDFGTALIVAGSAGMAGAARLCSEACARTGAGLTILATHPDYAALLSMVRPEIMSYGITSPEVLPPLLARATVLALGPGLIAGNWTESVLSQALQTALPTVIDAGALDFICPQIGAHPNWILTPHPGEAARLLQTTSHVIQANRLLAIKQLQAKYGCVVVLKGAGSLICTGTHSYICPAGNPGMASGGMGDVLTGIITGLLAQSLSLRLAAQLGVMLHACAGDQAKARQGERGLLALDLLRYLPGLLNQVIKPE